MYALHDTPQDFPDVQVLCQIRIEVNTSYLAQGTPSHTG